MKKEISDVNAENTEQKENEVSEHDKVSDLLKKNSSYKFGKRLYDTGLAVMLLIVLLNLLMNFMKIEFYIGGTICTGVLIFLYIIPCVMMIIGLVKSVKAAKKAGVKEKGSGVCFIISAFLLAFVIFAGTFETILPSYHVYELENVTASDGREFLAAKSETVKIFGERHGEMPSFYDIDIYDVHGIFAKRVVSCSAHTGEYKIEKTDNGKYKLIVSFLGRNEGYPFEG